jgi:hypothetical protein
MKKQISDFVTSFELSKELYDMGFRRDSIFSWFTDGLNTRVDYSGEVYVQGVYGYGATDATYPAYLSAELSEVLRPLYQGGGSVEFIKTHRYSSGTVCCEHVRGIQPCCMYDLNEANARAKMVIYLIKEKLIELNEKDTLPG